MIDFSMGWAGPICTRTLADLGADVIKIEAIQYPDWWRGVDRRPAYVLERMYEKSVRYCIMNRNKRGITLDLTRPQGLQLAKRLLADADLVVDNYSVEVLPKLGLGYEVLRQLNPKLVMMSMSAFGTGSIHRDCRAYGSTLEQGSGLPSVVGDANGPPVMSHTAFGDAVGGLNGCAAVLIALIHAQVDRQGPVHRPRADRMHDAVRRALDHRAFDRWQGARRNTATVIRILCRTAVFPAPAATTGSWSPFPAMRCGRSCASCWAGRTGPRMKR